MNFNQLYQQIEKEYDADMALMVVQINTINLTMKISEKDLNEPGRFTKRLHKKTYKLLWEYDNDKIELALKLNDVIQQWECGKSFQGLGGCIEKTFKELIKES